MNLLAMLDDRNLVTQAYATGLNANAVFVPEIVDIAALNNNYDSVDAFNAVFPEQGYDGGTFAGTFYTDGPLVNGFAGPWSDPAVRDARLDIVDQILGDATART